MKQNKLELNEILKDASKNAKNAIDSIDSEDYLGLGTSKEEKELWAMSQIIHCDTVRLFVAFVNCEKEVIARLLYMADIFSKLYEAKKWYFEKGNQALRDIARNNGVNNYFTQEIKVIKKNFPTKEIESFKEYRDKFSFHYDADALIFLQKFSNKESNFYEVVIKCIEFSKSWQQLAKEIIENNSSGESKDRNSNN